MHGEKWIETELNRIRSDDLDRHVHALSSAGGKIHLGESEYLNFSSNDYLDFANNPTVIESSRKYLDKYGCGSTASRLMSGSLDCHSELEKRIAKFKGYPTALLFGSGYLANIGTVPAIVGRGDFIVADKMVHASIIDGISLSKAKLLRFQHNDINSLQECLVKCDSGRCLIITESLFSMDGDKSPLKEIVELGEAHDAIVMVDEAHATGVFGPNGSGLIREAGLEKSVNISMGTMGKALGGYGGFVACSEAVRELLINRARGFIYTTALPPSVVGTAIGAIDALQDNPGLGEEALARATFFREELKAEGLNIGDSQSQIIPIIVGDSSKVISLSNRLKDENILAVAVRPPTVPEGTARLRLSITLAHTVDDLKWTAGQIGKCAKQEGLL